MLDNDAGGSAARIPVICYSTERIAPSDRHEAWRNKDGPIAPLFQTYALEPFNIASKSFVLGCLQIQYVEITSQRFERDRSYIGQVGGDALVVSLRIAGGAKGDFAGRSFDASTGTTVFMDLARPSVHVSEPANTILILVPRVIAERRLLPMRDLHGLVLSPARSALLRAFMLQILPSIDQISAQQANRMADIVIDLLAVAVAREGENGLAAETRENTIKVRARAEVEARLGSATLDADALCRTLRISRSTLYRMFEAEGGIQTYIRNRRLERVRSELENPAARDGIAEIAQRWGFFDPSYFSRVFRESFGATPRDYRAAVATPSNS